MEGYRGSQLSVGVRVGKGLSHDRLPGHSRTGWLRVGPHFQRNAAALRETADLGLRTRLMI